MMAPVIALTPALQRFDWGSSQGIPDLWVSRPMADPTPRLGGARIPPRPL